MSQISAAMNRATPRISLTRRDRADWVRAAIYISSRTGSTIGRPSFYIGGELDVIAGNTPDAIAAMKAALPDLRHCELLPGAGHWIQQERAAEVNEALLAFLGSLDA